MQIENIPPHLRNTVEFLDLPLYIDLSPGQCRPPANLALGDTLMVLGLLRNQGRPVKLYLNPGPALELVQGHPMVQQVLPPDGQASQFEVLSLPRERSGRAVSWTSDTSHRLFLPVLPVDEVRANPIVAHSLYFKLPQQNDRPSLFLDPDRPAQLKTMLSSTKPLAVLYPFNPGRKRNLWQDAQWWARLMPKLKAEFSIALVGAEEYGELAGLADICLAQSDSASTLWDIAWLISQAKTYIGRDGGISHLAAAVHSRPVVVWDSMASFRYWAGSQIHNIVMSNPYIFRYPQTMRLSQTELMTLIRRINVCTPDGQERIVVLPDRIDEYEKKATELFGSWSAFLAYILSGWELKADQAGVTGWWNDLNLRHEFYSQSIEFALEAAHGNLKQGANWVVPVAP